MGYIDAHVSFHVLQPSMYAPPLDLPLATHPKLVSSDLVYAPG